MSIGYCAREDHNDDHEDEGRRTKMSAIQFRATFHNVSRAMGCDTPDEADIARSYETYSRVAGHCTRMCFEKSESGKLQVIMKFE